MKRTLAGCGGQLEPVGKIWSIGRPSVISPSPILTSHHSEHSYKDSDERSQARSGDFERESCARTGYLSVDVKKRHTGLSVFRKPSKEVRSKVADLLLVEEPRPRILVPWKQRIVSWAVSGVPLVGALRVRILSTEQVSEQVKTAQSCIFNYTTAASYPLSG